MEDSDNSILFVFIVVGFIWLLPFLTIIFSSKTSGREKLA